MSNSDDNSQQNWMDTRVRLMVFADHALPLEVTKVLGVQPSRTWLKGEPVSPGSSSRRDENGWELDAPIRGPGVDPQEALRRLLALVPERASFLRLPPECSVQITFTLYGKTGRPSLWLESDVLKELAAIGASLDVDTYDLSDAKQ